jgi:murein L,D-transpeptidase YafK
MRKRSRSAALVVVLAVLVGVCFVNRHSLEAALHFAAARAAGSSDRVKEARVRLKDTLPALFVDKKVAWPPQEVFLRAIKEDDDGKPGVVELWAKDKNQPALTLIKSYPICALSGTLGPKRREGDLQIPEGFYTISKLNPQSSYHLSMRVDYPNASDRVRGKALDAQAPLGGDIMVHGECVTIGCIPLENEPIEEVYLAADAVFHKRTLPIHIFPRRLDEASLQKLLSTTTDETLKSFWRELALGYQAFETTRKVPKVTVGKDGAYVVVP